MLKFFVIIFLLPLYICILNAATIEQIQEVRYTKALIAHNDQNYNLAFRYISENLKINTLHLPTIKLLAKVHEEMGQHPKALRAYYFAIKQFHGTMGPLILAEPDLKKIKKLIQESDTPSQDVLEIYHLIAEKYQALYKKQADQKKSKKVTKSLFTASKKYFLVCQWFNYNASQMAMKVGLLTREYGRSREAIQHFKDAKDLLKDSKLDEQNKKEILNSLDYYMGEELTSEGNIDLATRYFKTVRKTTKDRSLKELSNQYINYLNDYSFSASVGLDVNTNSNANQLSRRELKTFSQNRDLYGTKSGFSSTKSASLFYRTKTYGKNSYIISTGASEEIYFKSELLHNDSRSFYISPEFIHYSSKYTWKINWTASLDYGKDTDKPDFYHTSTTHIITPSVDKILSSSILSLTLPYSVTENSDLNHTTSQHGISIFYTPLPINKFFAPSYGLQYDKQYGGDDEIIYSIYTLSMTNQINLSTNHSLSLTGDFVKTVANRFANSEDELHFGTLFLWDSNLLSGLSAKLSYDFYYARTGNNFKDSKKNSIISAGVSYNF